ncbi:hypothetical protein KDA23_03220, partial [Candidatus Saccharibacteria bacterium]|nr:hypothetical protein [Candidatus Saccharibacteria bacterium]
IMADNIRAAAASGDVTRTAHELAKIAGRYDAMASVAPENADVLAHEVMSQELSYMAPEMAPKLDPKGKVIGQEWTGNYIQKTATVRQAIEDWRPQGEFQDMRREYQSAAVAGASAAAAATVANPAVMGPPSTPTQ